MSWPHILIFAGAILAAVGGVWAAYEQSHFEMELREKNEQTIASIQETLKFVTGGDSFAYLDFHFHTDKTVSPIVISSGQYPLFDVSVRIADLDKMNALHKEMKNITMDAMTQVNKLLDVGNMTPNTAATRNDVRWDLPTDAERKAYNIFINARNGNFEQNYNFRKVNGYWKRAYRVFKQAPGEKAPLYEWANDDYPRNEKGEIEWFE